MGIRSLFYGVYVKTVGSPDVDRTTGSAAKVVASLLVLLISWSWPILLSVSPWYFVDIHLVAFTFLGM